MSKGCLEALIHMKAHRENLPSTSEIVYYFRDFRKTQAALQIEYANFLAGRKSVLAISYSKFILFNVSWSESKIA